MEIVVGVVGVLVLAVLNKWNERRLARRIDDSMDKVMGRKDP